MAGQIPVINGAIRLEGDTTRLPKMVEDARRVGKQIEREFEGNFSRIGRLAENAIKGPRTITGALDIDIDSIRKATDESRKLAAAQREIATAARAAANADSAGNPEPRLRAIAKAAEAKARAMEEDAREAERNYRAHVKLNSELAKTQQAMARQSRSGLNTSFGVDSLLGGSGALDRAAASGVTLEQVLGRVSNKGREVTQALQGMSQTQDTLAKHIERVNRATLTRANSETGADRILGGKAAIDRAAMSMATLESVMGRLSREGQKSRASLLGVGDASEQMAKRGTTANQLMVNSAKSLRIATMQAGQQFQDIAISMYSGQQASVVLAQQLPQLAFAFSYLEGSANKTHDKIGRFATFLSKPLGFAVTLGVVAIGTLISSLISTGEEADDTGSAVSRLKDKLDLSKNSYKALTEVVKEYNKTQERTEALTLRVAEAAAQEARQLLLKARAQLEALRAAPTATGGDDEAALAGRFAAERQVEGRIQRLEQEIRNAERAVADIGIKGQLDPAVAAQQAADSRLAILEEEQKKGLKNTKQYADERLKIERALQTELERIRKSKTSASSGSNNSRDARVGDMTALIQQLFPGARITSTTGGKHTKGSDHYAGRAIDFVPAGGMGQYSTADVQRILEEAGVTIRRNAGGKQQLFGPGRSASKPGDHDDHFHVAWSGSPSPERANANAERAAREAERAAEAAARLAEFGRDARAQIDGIGASFARTPPAIQESQRELERLNDLSADIMLRKPEGWEAMLAAIQALKPAAEELANGPFRDMLESAEEQATIEQLLIAGKSEEAEIQRRIFDLVRAQGPLTAGQEETVRALVAQERARARLLEQQADARERELRLLEDTRNNITQTTYELLSGKGVGSIGNFFKRQFDNVMADMAESITESLFGDIFRDQKDKILGFDKVKESSLETARTSNVASDALSDMARAARNATDALAGVAANDNTTGRFNLEEEFDKAFPGITVTGRRDPGKIMKDALKGVGKDIFGDEAITQLSKVMKTGMEGAAIGQMASGLVKSLGIKQSKTGAQVGGAIGGAALGPLGAIGGGLLGGTIGGFFKNSRSAGATITGANSISLGGKDGKNYGAASDLAGSVVSRLQGIAEQLGGRVGSFNTTIGVRGGDYRVNTSGSSMKVKNGATDFNDDAEGAIKFAIADAIKDGALIGLRAATTRLLQTGSDMDAQLAKAVKFQSVFDELEAIKDPVGAAVKSLNREFEGLIAIFREAGASVEEYGQLEELYNHKRVTALEEANNRVVGSFRSFIDRLTIGNDALSLRDRQAEAMSRYSALAERVKAGDTTAYDEYQEVASSLLDIQRQISGSQTEYFALLAEVTALSRSVVDATGKVAALPGSFADLMGGNAGAAGGAPNWSAYLKANPDVLRDYTARVDKNRFATAEAYGQWHYDNYGRAEGRALPSGATANNQQLEAAILSQTDMQAAAFRAMNDNLGALIRQNSGNSTYLRSIGTGGNW